jgi:hypothetical protein
MRWAGAAIQASQASARVAARAIPAVASACASAGRLALPAKRAPKTQRARARRR